MERGWPSAGPPDGRVDLTASTSAVESGIQISGSGPMPLSASEFQPESKAVAICAASGASYGA